MKQLGLGSAALAMADGARDGYRLVPGGPGRTRIGGLPDLPPETGWPVAQGRPLEFVAQIDLAELDRPGRALPARGLLSVFLDEHDWGAIGGRVLHHDLPRDAFSRRSPPPGPERRRLFGLLKTRDPVRIFREAAMRLEPVLTLPDDGFPGVSRAEWDALGPLRTELNEGDRLLGHAHPVRGRHGGRLREPHGHPGRSLRLLLQIDTDEKHSDMMWGDVGTLYGWIPAEDAPAGRFDRVVTLAQCC
jgi:hypothetical protein